MAKDGFPLDDLRLALAEADLALAAANAPEKKRIAVLLALKAIYDFSKSVSLKSRALNALSMALQDIDRGKAAALFAPRITNRPRDSARLFSLGSRDAASNGLGQSEKRSSRCCGAETYCGWFSDNCRHGRSMAR
jgi:hypothetical protein